MAVAQKDFGGKTDREPTLERVIFQDDSGKYHSGYRAELTNTTDASKSPRRMNYLIDGDTGKVVQKLQPDRRLRAARPARPAGRRGHHAHSVTGTATPKATIKDLTTTTSKITLGDDVTIDKLKLDLDIAHTYRGDLVVTLTSPSGKTAVISNRAGGSADDLKGSFDLSAVRRREDQGRLDADGGGQGQARHGHPEQLGPDGHRQGGPAAPASSPGRHARTTPRSTAARWTCSTKKNADGTYSLDDTTRGKGVVTRGRAQQGARATRPAGLQGQQRRLGRGQRRPAQQGRGGRALRRAR